MKSIAVVYSGFILSSHHIHGMSASHSHDESVSRHSTKVQNTHRNVFKRNITKVS